MPLVFVLVFCVTWMLCAPLRATPEQIGGQEIATIKTGFADRAAGRSEPLPDDKRTPLQAVLTHHRVEIVGQRALVSAQAQVFDREPNQSYLWVLRVISPQREVLQKWVNDEEILTVPLGEEVTPAFQASIDIPPAGSYIQAALYRFPTGSDLSFLAVDMAPKPFEVVYGSSKVSHP